MPYQILTRQNTGTYSTLVGSATKAVVALEALRIAGHTDVLLRDLDGNNVDWTALLLRIANETPSVRYDDPPKGSARRRGDRRRNKVACNRTRNHRTAR